MKRNKNKEFISGLREKLKYPSESDRLLENGVREEEFNMVLDLLEEFYQDQENKKDELSESYQMLERERSKFAGLFNLAPVGYFILDHLGIVEEANQTGADILRCPKYELLHKPFQYCIFPTYRENFSQFLDKMRNIEVKQSCEISLYQSGDKELYTRLEGIAVYDSHTQRHKFYVTVIDISESRNAQQKLINTTHRLNMTLTASGTGTWTMELAENRFFLDEFSHTILELDASEFNGSIQALLALIHAEDQGAVRRSVINAVNLAEDLDLEFRIITRTGRIKNISIKGQQVLNELSIRYFAGIIVDITERKRMAQIAENMKTEQQRLILSATFDAQEKERYTISSALHDSVCQILYGIRLNLQNIQHLKNLKGEFKNVNKLIDQVIREIRELSYELTPSVLRDFGFNAGVREMAQRLSTTSFIITTSLKGSFDRLKPEIQIYTFRIIQELINNCIKHAQATQAEISVSTAENDISIVVSDNGRGFQQGIDEALYRGAGIRGIKNRVFLLNGSMVLKSSKAGTSVIIQFTNAQKFPSSSSF